METPRIVVAGGGPAGCAAAVMLANYDRPALLVEPADRLGGLQARSPYPNSWVLGRPGRLSRELAADMDSHVRQTPTGLALGWRLSAVDPGADGTPAFHLTLTRDGDNRVRQVAADAVILALGTRFRGRSEAEAIPGYAQVRDHILHDPIEAAGLNPLDADAVLIVGGGDNAFEAAVWNCERGLRVHVVVRARVRAQLKLRERLHPYLESAQASLYGGCQLQSMRPEGPRVAVTLGRKPGPGPVGPEPDPGPVGPEPGPGLVGTDPGPGPVVVDRVMFMLGYTPAVDRVQFAPTLRPAADATGYLMIDAHGATSVPGIWSAGDLSNPLHPCVTTAMAAGTVAAQAVESHLTLVATGTSSVSPPGS